MIIYTALFGNTDPLHEPTCKVSSRMVCFTDRPIQSKRWEIVRTEPTDTPTRKSRTLKCLAHTLFPDEDSWLWQDCCFSLLTDPKPMHEDIVTFKHVERSRIIDEAVQIAKLGKARPEDVFRQVADYNAQGFDTPENPMTSLSCNGIVFRRNTPKIIELNELWAEQLKYTLRDQMSLDYCAWKLGIKLTRFPWSHYDNPLAKHHPYKRPVNDY